MEILAILLLIGLAFELLVIAHKRRQVKRWVKSLTEPVPLNEDWKFGTPDDPIPKSAVPLDLFPGRPTKNYIYIDVSDPDIDSKIEKLVEVVKQSRVGPIEVSGEGRGLPNLSNRKDPEKK